MNCPACARPIATAHQRCLYCGAPISSAAQAEAAAAAQRVLRSKHLTNLEAAAEDHDRGQAGRTYVVLDTNSASADIIAQACRVSIWQARQWQGSSRYRLLKVCSRADDQEVSQLENGGLSPILVSEEAVARLRFPRAVDSIDVSTSPSRYALRDLENAEASWRALDEKSVFLLVSAPIRRERVRSSTTAQNRPAGRMEDAWLVHLHVEGDERPWEIDPLRTSFEGSTLASAHMSTLDLVRRLSATIPYDDSFKNVVPALAPGIDPLAELGDLRSPRKKGGQEQKAVVLDNVAQFREYSAWRGAVEAALRARR